MTFAEAVNRTPSIKGHLRSGLKALRRADRSRVSCDGRNLVGSIDIDGALRYLYPRDARWDYAVGVSKSARDFVVWLEVHPASSLHVDEVLDKVRWLKQWLETSAPELRGLDRHLCRIATGGVSFGRGSPQARRIAQEGLRFPVKHADLDGILAGTSWRALLMLRPPKRRVPDTQSLRPLTEAPATASLKTRMEVNLTPELRAKLQGLAAEHGRDTQALAQEAIERFVDCDEWFLREVGEGLAAADRGEFIEDEDVRKLIDTRYPG